MYDVPATITLADLLAARIGEGFRLLPARASLDGDEHAHAAGATGRGVHGEVILRLCCEWTRCEASGLEQSQAATIEYIVSFVSSPPPAPPRARPRMPTSSSAVTLAPVVEEVFANDEGAAPRAPPSTPPAAAAPPRAPGGMARGRGALRVYLSVVAPLPFWLRFERARLHRRQGSVPERSDASALQGFSARPRPLFLPRTPVLPPPSALAPSQLPTLCWSRRACRRSAPFSCRARGGS